MESFPEYESFLTAFEPLRIRCILYQRCVDEIIKALISEDKVSLKDWEFKAREVLANNQDSIDMLTSDICPLDVAEYTQVQPRLMTYCSPEYTVNGKGNLRIINRYRGTWNPRMTGTGLIKIPESLLTGAEVDCPAQPKAELQCLRSRASSLGDLEAKDHFSTNESQSESGPDSTSPDLDVLAIGSEGDDDDELSAFELHDNIAADLYRKICYIVVDAYEELKEVLENNWSYYVFHLLKYGAVRCLSRVHETHPERFNKRLLDLAASLSPLNCFKMITELTGHIYDWHTLARASEEDNMDVVMYLLNNGCAIANTCMSHACHRGNVALVRALIDRGIAVNYVSICNASMGGHSNLAMYLLRRVWKRAGGMDKCQIVANLAGCYETKALIRALTMTADGPHMILRSIIHRCINYSNAASLFYCLSNTKEVVSYDHAWRAAVEVKSSMIHMVLHSFCATGMPSYAIDAAVEHGNIPALVHYRLTCGVLDVYTLIQECRRKIMSMRKSHCRVVSLVELSQCLLKSKEFLST